MASAERYFKGRIFDGKDIFEEGWVGISNDGKIAEMGEGKFPHTGKNIMEGKDLTIDDPSFISGTNDLVRRTTLMKEGSSIVNILSRSAKEALPNLVISNSFRPALAGLAKTLSIELAPRAIRRFLISVTLLMEASSPDIRFHSAMSS